MKDGKQTTKEQFFVGLAVCISILSLYRSTIREVPPQNIDSMKAEIENQKTSIDNLKNQINTLSDDFMKFGYDYYTSNASSASFTPTDSTFFPIRTAYGNLMVSLENTEKLGDGYKLIFSFGNPTSMSISDLKGKITWRPRVDYKKYYGDMNYKNEIDQKTHSKEFSVLSDLYPGAWNENSITIGPATEDEIGEISISDLQAPKVSMRTLPRAH
jgi:hypothetical protein